MKKSRCRTATCSGSGRAGRPTAQLCRPRFMPPQHAGIGVGDKPDRNELARPCREEGQPQRRRRGRGCRPGRRPPRRCRPVAAEPRRLHIVGDSLSSVPHVSIPCIRDDFTHPNQAPGHPIVRQARPPTIVGDNGAAKPGGNGKHSNEGRVGRPARPRIVIERPRPGAGGRTRSMPALLRKRCALDPASGRLRNPTNSAGRTLSPTLKTGDQPRGRFDSKARELMRRTALDPPRSGRQLPKATAPSSPTGTPPFRSNGPLPFISRRLAGGRSTSDRRAGEHAFS